MEENFYKNILAQSAWGYAYHKIIVDGQNKPIDYVFLEVNDAFERLTGLKKKNILHKKATDVLPGIRKDFDWVSLYGKVALEIHQSIDDVKILHCMIGLDKKSTQKYLGSSVFF